MKPHVLAGFVLCALLLSGLASGQTTIYVDDDAPNDPGPGNPAVSDPIEDGSAAHPFDAIQEGIDVAVGGDTVLVKDGTYTGTGNRDLDFGGLAITVESEHGADTCVIDCGGAGRGFYFHSGETAASVVDGLTITNGYADNGGGIYCDGSSPAITNCTISGNSTTIFGTSITGHGAGIYARSSDVTITNCTISGNTASEYGGGIYCRDGVETIARCTITGNDARSGGGICCEYESDAAITNCIITDNWGGYGGGVRLYHTDATVTNCTIRNNAASYGGGIYKGSGATGLTTNCILWDNFPDQLYYTGAGTVRYCNVEGGTGESWFGTGCIDTPPLLTPDGHLLAASPCIDQCPTGPPDDWDGEARPFPVAGDGDIGADEFVDTDSDGLPDWWELEYFGSATAADPGADEEPDGLTNTEEYELGGDPVDADTDDDGRDDGQEINDGTSLLNPDNAQKTYYVNGDPSIGNDAYDGLAATYDGTHGPKRTIRAGLDCAVVGLTYRVSVAPWTYTGESNRDLDFRGKSVRLKSENGAEHTVIDCEGAGRGFYFRWGETSASVIDGFTITGGSTYNDGGGLRCRDSSPTITNCIIRDNSATDYGGGIFCYGSSPRITNCTIRDNRAVARGGGIGCWEGGSPTIANCTITGNSANHENGGGVYCYYCSPTITNSILWGNSPEQIYRFSSTPAVSYCDVEGGTGEPWFGTGCIDTPPLLTSDGHLTATSPCIDRCPSPSGPWDDRDGEARPVDVPGVGNDGAVGTYDMGADEFVDTDSDGLPDSWELEHFSSTTAADPGVDEEPDGLTNLAEYECSTDPMDADTDDDGRDDGQEISDGSNPLHPDNAEKTYYVNGDPLVGDDGYDGLAPSFDGVHGPKRTIQAGIDAAIDGWGYTVSVAPWTYTGTGNRDLDFGGIAITVASQSGPATCIIDCEGAGRGFNFQSGETAASVVDGLTITNGSGVPGGGIYCEFSNPTVTGCTITGNTGNGIYCFYGCTPTITNCTITGNSGHGIESDGDPTIFHCTISSNGSAGILCELQSATIADCTITGNNGAGISCFDGGSPTITNCTITGNSGGISCYEGSNPAITNCLITGNSGSGIFCFGNSDPTMTNCTITGNVASSAGGGIYCQGYCDASMTNCVMWGNEAPLGHEIYVIGDTPSYPSDPSTLTVRYSDVQGGAGEAYVGAGCTLDLDGTNINWDPKLTADGRLGAGSPCIDWCPTGTATDLAEAMRPVDVPGVGFDGLRLFDIGAYEVQDSDSDGMGDAWETEHGLDPDDPTDAALDTDGDWLLNVDEYAFGSDTQDANSPASLYVDDDALGNPVQDGTPANPYEAIQVAIGAAMPPAVVKVMAGTYNEAVLIPAGIGVIGPGAGSATISAGDTAHAVEFVDAGNGLLAGFAVTAGGTTYHGLRTTGFSSPRIRNCTFTGSRSGMGLAGDGTPHVVNCLIAGNPYQGIFTGDTAAVTVANCTIADNGANGVVKWGSGTITITNSILCGNADDINGSAPAFAVSYCDIGDGDFAGSNGNISADPLFVAGVLHGYCLSQTAAGQGINSPCMDTGSDTAANLGFATLTTRTDGADDTGLVDMGYHDAYSLRITDVYWDQATTSVVVAFSSKVGVDYAVEVAEADAYAEGLTWANLAPVTASGPTTTVADDLSTSPLAHAYRFYRVKRADESEWGLQTAAVFELDLNVGFAVRRFFVSTPLEPDPDHAGVDAVLSTQLNYANVKLDKLTAETGLYSRATYAPGAGWANVFSIAAGEAYWLDVGAALPFPHTVRLTGYVPTAPLTVSVTRASFAVTYRWMAYGLPRPTTLGGLGLETAITPFWDSTNEVRLLPLSGTIWSTYRWDGVKWYNVATPGVDAGATPIACGEGILFIHNGIPGQPDTLTWPTWYLYPPNVW